MRSIRSLTTFLAMTAIFSLPSMGTAQHAQESALILAPEHTGCGFCHGSHLPASDGVGAGGRHALRLDRLPGIWGMESSGVVDPGPASRSCLRCHVSPGVRLRQPEFERAGSGSAADGAYLRTDFSDDHPIGRINGRSRPLVDVSFRNPSVERLSGMRRSFDPFSQHQLECTTCHDPHDRGGSSPGPEKQQVLCGTCHEHAVHGRDPHNASLACSDCHGMHGGSEMSLLAERDSDVLCASCHGGGVAPSGDLDRRAALLQGPQGHLQAQPGRCITCHPVHL